MIDRSNLYLYIVFSRSDDRLRMQGKRGSMENNRQKIIDTASRLFCEKGIAGTSLADISRQAKISKGTLYYYYSTKNDLVFDITEKHIEKITNELFSMINHDFGKVSPDNILRLLFETILNDETRNRLHLYLIQEAMSGNEQLKQRFQKRYPHWRDLVEKGINKLFPDKSDQGINAHILVAVFDGLIIQSMLEVEDIPVKSIIERMIKLM